MIQKLRNIQAINEKRNLSMIAIWMNDVDAICEMLDEYLNGNVPEEGE